MTVPEPEDQNRNDVRPLVATAASNRSVWIFAGGLTLAGILLFQTLEARRTNVTAPSVIAPQDDGQTISGAPELFIPPHPPTTPPNLLALQQPTGVQPAATADPAPRRAVRMTGDDMGGRTYVPPPYTMPPSPSYRDTAPGDQQGPGWAPNPARVTNSDQKGGASGKDRVQASHFSNPATTVPKGNVIQAVLESALDSTRGGFARAIVSRDIYGFDGTRILIPRGSRIIGEYKSDVSLGQRRILIQWQRLMRPDGVMIDIDSPSADPLGRAGVQGSVNTHFFERFGGAILQSSLDIGVQLAARAASHDTVVLALPGGIQQGSQQVVQPERVQPTVKVRQGTSLSVFVAKDLDFTDVEE